MTSSYTLSNSDNTVLADATPLGFNLTLPSAATVRAGKKFTVKKISSGINAVVVQTTGAETMDGITNLRLNQKFDYLTLMSDGSNWLNTSERISPSFVNNPASPYNATPYDQTISISNGKNINLPSTADVLTGKTIVIKNTSSSDITITASGAQTIDGSNTFSLTKNGNYLIVQSNGSNWIIIGYSNLP